MSLSYVLLISSATPPYSKPVLFLLRSSALSAREFTVTKFKNVSSVTLNLSNALANVLVKYVQQLKYLFVTSSSSSSGSTPNLKQKIAREHYLLRSERPARVTLLALTRDAVARLPWGFGTRNDICNLVKQSQYIHTNVADTQVSVMTRL